MKLYELKQIIKEEIYKELNEVIFNTTCTLDDLHEKIEEICKKRFRSAEYEIRQNDSKNMVLVDLNYGKYQSNDLTFIQRGQTDKSVYEKLKEKCDRDFEIFSIPLRNFCTGILKLDRPGITMYTQHSLPVNKVDEKIGETKPYMYKVIANWDIDGNYGANYNESKEEINQRLSDDSVRSISDVAYMTFSLRS